MINLLFSNYILCIFVLDALVYVLHAWYGFSFNCFRGACSHGRQLCHRLTRLKKSLVVSEHGHHLTPTTWQGSAWSWPRSEQKLTAAVLTVRWEEGTAGQRHDRLATLQGCVHPSFRIAETWCIRLTAASLPWGFSGLGAMFCCAAGDVTWAQYVKWIPCSNSHLTPGNTVQSWSV